MVKVGILGTGFGKEHARIYSKMEEVEIAGVFGRSTEKLEEIGKSLDVRTTTDIEQLLTDPTVDLIDICLPTSLHAGYAVKAMQHGKHVFCETPVSMTVEEAERMRDHARQYNRLLFVDLFYKFSAPHKHACDLVRSGSLGMPLAIGTYNETPPIWGDLGLAEIVLKFMLHNFDFVTEIMGVPESVMAAGVGRTNESYVTATLRYADGLAVVESSSMMPGRFPFSLGFSVNGGSGIVTYDGRFGEETIERATLCLKEGNPEELAHPAINEYEEVIRHVIECVRHGCASSVISIDHAITSLRIAEAVNESLRTHCPVAMSRYGGDHAVLQAHVPLAPDL